MVFYKKCVLKYFGKFTGKDLWQSLFLDKLQDYKPAKCKLSETLKKDILQDTYKPLLLNIVIFYEVGEIYLTLLENASEDYGKLLKILKIKSDRNEKAFRTKIKFY